MRDKGATLIVVLFGFCLLMSTSSIAFASSDNWVEIITFTHSVSGLAFLHPTSHFTVDYVDWRIRWEVNPGNASERGTSFNAYVFPETSGTSIEEMHYTIGTEKTTGIKNIYNHRGSFYIVVQTTNIDDIKLIIEQNIDSIPEFPSWTILPLFLIATLFGIIIRKKFRDSRTYSMSQ